MSESDMIRGFFKEILKPIIAEAIAEAGYRIMVTMTNVITHARRRASISRSERLRSIDLPRKARSAS